MDGPPPSVQESVEATARGIVRGYPLAASLTPISQVINALPAPSPHLPTLFPLDSSSLAAGPHEPLFDQYSAELEAFLGAGPSDPVTERWKQDQLRRVSHEVGDEVDMFRNERYGALHFPPIPTFPPTPVHTSAPALSSFATNFLAVTSFPGPPPPPPSTSPPPLSSEQAQAFLETQAAHSQRHSPATPASISPPRRVSQSQVNSASPTRFPFPVSNSQPHRPSQRTADSSPDPLRMSPIRPLPKPRLSNGALGGSSRVSTPIGAPDRKGFAVFVPSPTEKQRGSFLHLSSEGGGSGRKLTESQRARMTENLDTPEAKGPLGVESAVKKIKLTGTWASGGTVGTNGSGKSGAVSSLMDKFTDLTSDIFSADDALVADTSSSHLNAKSPSAGAASFFRTTATSSDGLALLRSETIAKILKQLQAIAAKGKGDELLDEVEEGEVSRLLKLLERSWRGIEDGSYWPSEALEAKPDVEEAASAKKGAKKGKGKAGLKRTNSKARKDLEDDDASGEEEEEVVDELGSSPNQSRSRQASTSAGLRRSSRSRSRTPIATASVDIDVDVDEDGDGDGESPMWSGDVVIEFQQSARSLSDAVLAIRTALAILTIATLPKSLYSIDYILSMIVVLRHSLDAFVFPFLEADPHSHLADLLRYQGEAVASVYHSLELVFAPLSSLIRQDEMPEDIIIPITYFFLSPFFHEAPVVPGRGTKAVSDVATALKGIRMASLTLGRTVVGRYPDQREWIIEEVLNNITKLDIAKKGKGGHRLRTGATIHTVSALILHLVQTVPSDLAGQMKSHLTAGADVVMRDSQEKENNSIGSPVDALSKVFGNWVDPALEASTKSARAIVTSLLSRSCKSGKIAGGSTESEYRVVLDNLVTDLLATLYLPEWPASQVLLTACCKAMMNSLMDTKTSHEMNALKLVALEHLGPIAARIRQELLAAEAEHGPHTLQEILVTKDLAAVDELFTSHVKLVAHLSQTERSTATEGAAVFSVATFSRDLLQASRTAVVASGDTDFDEMDADEGDKAALVVSAKLAVLAEQAWIMNLADDDVFGPSHTDTVQREIDLLAVQIGRGLPLATLYASILTRIVNASESTIVAFRTKSLRGIGLIVAQDTDLFLQDEVRESIRNRILDTSPAVRDVALDLVGKYCIKREDLAIEYLPQILDRITDTGLSVRRRVVKLLKTLYGMISDPNYRFDICRQLVWRVLDDDEGIKELVVETVEDLWFPRTGILRNDAVESQPADAPPASSIGSLASIIVAVVGGAKERPPPVDILLRLIIAKHAEKGTPPPLKRLTQIIECLINNLVEDEEQTSVVECVKTVFILTSADPTLLSTSQANLLLPYLKSASTAAEQATSDYLLKIFRSMVTALPKGTSKFSRDLQAVLLPMVNRPAPSASTTTLQEIVSCLCAVVRGQTHDFPKLIATFKACAGRLGGETRKLCDTQTASQVNIRSFPMLCYLTALLCEHGQFDSIRIAHPETKAELDAIMKTSFSDFVFSTLIRAYNAPAAAPVQNAIGTSLGFIFRAYPTLMLKPGSTKMIDAVFQSADMLSRLHLLRLFQDFLASQERPEIASKSKKKADTGIKIEELVGNVEGFADSGVASAIAQRYIDPIIVSALSTRPQIQRVAVDILTAIARSGFSHPLTIAPPLIALAGSSDSHIASKTYSSLASLHEKHASLLATRYLPSVRTVHAYAQSVAGDQQLHGYHGEPPTSLLAHWFGLLKDRRQYGLDFIKAVCHAFDVGHDAPCSEDDLSFARFVAEALSCIEYKRLDEPMSIMYYLNATLAVTGNDVLLKLEATLEGGGGLLASVRPMELSPSKKGPNGSPLKGSRSSSTIDITSGQSVEAPPGVAPSITLARQSVVCGLALLLRDHLKQLYGISDSKMANFKVGRKSSSGDKAAVIRAGAILALGLDNYARMPSTLKSLESEEARMAQRDVYIELTKNDVALAEQDEYADDE